MSRLVLIADGNTGRGRRLAEACQTAGIGHKMAPHGAAALEMALVDRPQLVVAELGLPLVDAPKLAEILRANPRTRRVNFLYLSPDQGTDGRVRVGDVSLPDSSGPEELVRRIEEILEKQGRIEHLEEESQTGAAVEGDLRQLPLPDLLQLFHHNQRSGSLVLSRESEDGDEEGRVTISEGNVIQSEVDGVEGEKALFRLLAWQQGYFSFEPGESSEAQRIFAPTRTLLAEGLRQLEEWDRLAPRLPPLDSPVKLNVKTSELPNIVHPLTQEVLLLLELYPRVRDVVDHCTFPDYQVLRTLHTLAERGIIQLSRVPITAPVCMDEGLFTESQARRLRDWIREESPRDESAVDAKMVVVTSEPSGLLDFANLMEAVPQIEVYGLRPTEKGVEPDQLLAPVARVAVDSELGIEVYHLPCEPRYAPLWPLVGRGAVGVLFLLSGSVVESAERVRDISRAVLSTPNMRSLYVAMLHKDERISPEDLANSDALIDESSLFLLSLEGEKDPASHLRSLFARVVP